MNADKVVDALREMIAVMDGQLDPDVVDDLCPNARKTLAEHDAQPAQAAQPVGTVTDEMVQRFLGWRLPDTFAPDCYVSFDREGVKKMGNGSHWPTGTNLLNDPEARAMLEHVLATTSQPSADAATIALAALGHVRQPNKRCTARYAEVPKEDRPPGPHNAPVWCGLRAGHDGPHRCNHGGMHPSFVMRPEQTVMGEPLPDVCAKCGTCWPCPDAKTVIDAFDAARAAEGGE